MTHIAQYDALWQTLQTRRRTVEQPRGLDAPAQRWNLRLSHARAGVRRWAKLARKIDTLDATTAAMSEPELDSRLAALHEVFRRRHANESHLIDALAALRELAHRTLGQKPYVVQLIGGLAIYHGQIAEMVTGEGKTLTAALPATLLAWSRPAVHVVTANEYLAARDAAAMAPLYRRAGVDVAAVLPSDTTKRRAEAYRKPLVYTTQKELVADWLRDQLRLSAGGGGPVEARSAAVERLAPAPGRARSQQVLLPGLHAAIVDEADAVLIDQAVTPLIIAAPRGASASAALYARAKQFAEALREDDDYRLEPRFRRVRLSDHGKRRVAALLTDTDAGEWRAPRRRHELVEQALGARHFYRRGEQYELADGRVVMIDEFTGRFTPDRQWQHGMQQAVEAKEGLEISGDGRPLASLSFQRFFRLYPFLAGMTGTAAHSRNEFEGTYRTPVRVVPTHRPVRREAWPARVYATSEQRWLAVADEVAKVHASGRPVLVGTRSVAASERLSALLSERGLPHQLLNAIHHEREAMIIAQAGRRTAITVATNMAGRGTDIVLGDGVAELGGLHVILSEWHEAARVDEQLVGRAGRQGDPGSSRLFASLEDELLIKFRPGLMRVLQRRYRNKVGPLNSRAAVLLLRNAQRHAERAAHFSRRMILERDDWIDRVMPG